MPRPPRDRRARSIRLPAEIDDQLVAWAAEHAVSVNQATEHAVECLVSAKGGAERAAGKVPVPSAPSPAVPRTRDGTIVDPVSVAPARSITEVPHALAGCPHPKAQRQSLGYATRCGACGEMVKP